MQDYEKLGAFYLGRLYDLDAKKPKEDLLLYDSKDLVTHAVVVGMTGSGKTGLCVDLIEEAAIDGIPAILIDPKGDLCNLMLAFPNLRGENFLPWVNLDDARQKGLTPEVYAQQQAESWQKGLVGSGQSGERIQRLKDSADFRIYTPASNAGIPVSILKSFAAPPAEVLEDTELIRDRIGTTVTSLLGLIGIDADPVQSREYILLSSIIENLWRKGQDLDLAQLITMVQSPPMTKIGVLDLESFYPSKERFGLVMALNNLLASPGFSAWLEGEPLDIGQILYTPQGKPRIAIFSIAHLGDSERMFFVSLLLNQVLGWMRSQSGTSSLRALLYMDEIYGYLPPTSNPPSKKPMMTLLKQARAFGLGIVLATQNPVDLDYKALSNTGTWFIGRLQTERDKARVLEGLEGAAASAGAVFNRSDIDHLLSGLGNRVFLMNNTHEDAPVLMTTRWAMTYLRGPLTREQIKTVMAPYKAAQPAPKESPAPAVGTSYAAAAPSAVTQPVKQWTAPAAAAAMAAPALPPEVPQFYIPTRGRAPDGCQLVYQPRILGAGRVAFADTKTRINVIQPKQFMTEIKNAAIPVEWGEAQELDVAVADLERQPENGAKFVELPSVAGQAKSYTTWNRDFVTWLYGNQVLELMRSPSQGVVSNVGEDEQSFRVRLQHSAREKRDDAVDALRKKYAPKVATLQERLRKAQQAVQREKEQARQTGVQAALNVGASLLGAFTGRKLTTSVSSAARGIGRSMNERGDVNRAEDTVEAVDKQLKALQADFEAEAADLTARVDPATEQLDIVVIKPKKADIVVQLVALVWAPYWQDEQGGRQPAW